MRSEHDADQTRIVADADVLAADVLVGGTARSAVDVIRGHSWLELVVTEPVVDDAVAIIEPLSDGELAADWRDTIERVATIVEQPEGDHPALAAAYRGNAMHVVSLDERLLSAKSGAALKGALEVSVRSPDAFLAVVDPETIYELVFEEPYPGPDLDPRT